MQPRFVISVPFTVGRNLIGIDIMEIRNGTDDLKIAFLVKKFQFINTLLCNICISDVPTGI